MTAYIWMPSLLTLCLALSVFYLGYRIRKRYMGAGGFPGRRRPNPAPVRRPDAPVYFSCPRCQEALEGIARDIGSERSCPTCGMEVTVADALSNASASQHRHSWLDSLGVQIVVPSVGLATFIWAAVNEMFGIPGLLICGVGVMILFHFVRWVPSLLYNRVMGPAVIVVGGMIVSLSISMSLRPILVLLGIAGIVYVLIWFMRTFGGKLDGGFGGGFGDFDGGGLGGGD